MKDFIAWPKIARYFRQIVVTEKMDGTNAQLCFDNDGTLYVGSRSRWITPEQDNFGFATWAHENRERLFAALGPGRHYGEWVGKGIQRGYGMSDRKFFLFDQSFKDCDFGDLSVGVVPVLYEGPHDTNRINACMSCLRGLGSVAVPGYKHPEGIIVYHVAGSVGFKATLEGDEQRKGEARDESQ